MTTFSTKIHTLVLIFIISAASITAQVSMPAIFSNDMMFQRQKNIHIWGKAAKKERIKVLFMGKKHKTRADKQGNWSIDVDAVEAGGPYQLSVTGKKNALLFKNILIGDIWICGGQSNMEWFVQNADNGESAVADANFPKIRLFDIPHILANTPKDDIEGELNWTVCSPETVKQFSAVGYFFGKDIHEYADVPIGLLASNWGGTVVETWTSEQGYAAHPTMKVIAEKVKAKDFEKEQKEGASKHAKWLRKFATEDKGQAEGLYKWSNPSTNYSTWRKMRLPGSWETKGITDLKEMDGVIWFQNTFTLTPTQANKSAKLLLGPIDDSDIVWINGKKVGETYNHYNKDRKYSIPENVLKSGENTIVIRIEDYLGAGGPYGKSEEFVLKNETFTLPLSGDWHYKVGMLAGGMPSGGDFGPNSNPTLLFNGMIAPITPFPVKGVIWYQGESNAHRAYEYADFFKLLIQDWRAHWNDEKMPFLFVQLANFQAPTIIPENSTWAELRESQTKALALSNTGMATTIDIGMADNIHPTNKQEVGRRLALLARNMVYGEESKLISGPTFKNMKIKNEAIYLTFDNVGDGFIVKGKYGYLKEFIIAGEDQKFHWAQAQIIDNNTIKVWSSKVKKPVAARFGWADNPHELNLFNSENLPAVPFRTDTWEGKTFGVKYE